MKQDTTHSLHEQLSALPATTFVAGEQAPTPEKVIDYYYIPNVLGNLAIRFDVVVRDGVRLVDDEVVFENAAANLYPGSSLSGGVFLARDYLRIKGKIQTNGVYTGPGSELEIVALDEAAEQMLRSDIYYRLEREKEQRLEERKKTAAAPLSPAEVAFDEEMAAIIQNLGASPRASDEMRQSAEDVAEGNEAGQDLLAFLREYSEETFGPLG